MKSVRPLLKWLVLLALLGLALAWYLGAVIGEAAA